jgi:TatD DNase family protein
MNLIDIHAHLDTSQFKKDLAEVIARAREAGVKLIINSGVNQETNRVSLELAKKYDIIKLSFGIYPIDALARETGETGEFKGSGFDVYKEIAWMEENKGECIAIGEIGLDFNHKDSSQHESEQRELFIKQIELAKRIDKPIIVHSRKAEAEVIEILKEHHVNKVVLHCFCGGKKLIKEGIKLGFYFSVPPAIKRWENFKELVKLVPMTQLLTETDSPYLGQEAKMRNEPANVRVTIGEIAKIKNLNEEKVSEIIFNNAKILFDIKNEV